LTAVRFEIIFAPEAAENFRSLDAHVRGEVRDAIETHLRYEPTKLSKSRIKRLQGLRQPQFRLRIGEIRAFYDVVEDEVHVVAIMTKARAMEWLRERGLRE
jgi:mRNA-degrading endonuclease RelE of RelBE toxin-antitoxin system